MSKERLEEIKGRHTGDFGITDSDIDYLIEQNKRYRELLTSQTLKRLIRLESKGNFLPENWRNDYDIFKLEIEKLERDSQ